MLAWGFGFWMWRLTLTRGFMFPLSADYSVVMCGAWPGKLGTSPWHRLGMRYSCALRLWYQICVTCRSCRRLVVPGQHASGPRDGGICTRWIWSISSTQVLALLLRNVGFWALWCETELICIQSLLQHWPRWQNFWLLNNINDCCAGWGCACLFPVCGWFEWPSSGVVGFYNHESSWCCSLWLLNCVWLLWVRLSAWPMHVVEHLTSWWLMFLTYYGFLL